MEKCRAWVMVEPGKVTLEQFEIPKVAEDSALLKVEACGICATDKHVYQGHPSSLAQFPFIPGHEFIGTIVELGSRANETMAIFGGSLQVGDRVAVAPSSMGCGHCYFCLTMPHRQALCNNRSMIYGLTSTRKSPGLWGGLSEYVYIVPRSYVFKLPKDMPLKRAILIEPGATGLRAVDRGLNTGEPFLSQGLGVGRSVMVLGAGPIGLMIVAAYRYSGADLIIVQDLFPSRLRMAKRLGADLAIDGNLPFEERRKQVQEATGDVGPDIVVEAAGVPAAFREALDFTRRGGKLIEAGNFADAGPAEIRPFLICLQDLDILGCRYSPLLFKDVISMLKRTSIPVEEVVTHTFPLKEFPKALEVTGSKDAGKVVITP